MTRKELTHQVGPTAGRIIGRCRCSAIELTRIRVQHCRPPPGTPLRPIVQSTALPRTFPFKFLHHRFRNPRPGYLAIAGVQFRPGLPNPTWFSDHPRPLAPSPWAVTIARRSHDPPPAWAPSPHIGTKGNRRQNRIRRCPSMISPGPRHKKEAHTEPGPRGP